MNKKQEGVNQLTFYYFSTVSSIIITPLYSTGVEKLLWFYEHHYRPKLFLNQFVLNFHINITTFTITACLVFIAPSFFGNAGTSVSGTNRHTILQLFLGSVQHAAE